MSNFNNKNHVWGKQHNIGNQNKPLMNQGTIGNVNTSGMVPFQQQQVFQNAMGLQQPNLSLGLQQMANNQLNAAQIATNPLFQHVGAVSYPNPRALNPTAFQTPPLNSQMQNSSNQGTKQRVFTGVVTQVHDNFGFIDDEVFFPRNVCVKGSNPMVGDRVLVEASFNSSMPFKWNASRVQVLLDNSNGNDRFGRNNRPKASVGGRGRERSRDRDRDDDEMERKRRREERMREREKEERKSPIRRRSRSPKSRRRPRIVPRYMVQIPKIALDLPEADVLEVKRRYNNLYIPSDFFTTKIRWIDAFPTDKPFALNKSCSFHVMSKEIDPVVENSAVLEPPDADYSFSAKVMLLSVPSIEELYQKCCGMAEDRDKRDRDSEDRDFIHPSRLISFLVGLRGKSETMAIGGPWSPSFDGENPHSDPSVLIRTAIRTCKALTGIDLSNCTQWYRFIELYYRRSESMHKGKQMPARVETTVVFLPDVWSCLPTRLEWEGLQQTYRKQVERILKAEGEQDFDDGCATDEKEEESMEKPEPTHYSQLDPKTMAVNALRTELKARDLSTKGLKAQLVARLSKALKSESEQGGEFVKEEEMADVEELEVVDEEKKPETEPKKLDEKEKALLEKRHNLPEAPHLVVHPSRTAKSGKFDCTVMSLSLLLDYRPEDTKEHSFEVSLFAELFNEMLMRDFGFNIVKALYELPDKPKEKEDDKKKKEDKKKDKKDEDRKKDEDKLSEKDQKSEDGESKKDDAEKRKESRRDERKSEESGNDDDLDDDDRKDRKDKDKKKKDRVKLYTRDKHLLLSFVYFDQTHCGYIFDKDIEELIYTLGLHLSRAQVKKLINKVITRDSLHYRKLTDKPKEEETVENESKPIDWEELSLGNKKLLPVFHDGDSVIKKEDAYQSDAESGLVTYRGAVVDVGKLLSQLERSEATRLETETRMVDLKNENSKLSEKYAKSNSTIKHMHSELKECKEKLRTTEDSLGRANAHSKLFQTTLIDIRDKIDPVLKTVSHKEEKDRRERDRDDIKKERDRDLKDNDKERKLEEKSRWEKDVKKDSADREIKKEPEENRNDKLKSEDEKIKKEEEVKKENEDVKKEDSK